MSTNDQTLQGSSGNDELSTDDGNDVVRARGGDDVIDTGAGDDAVYAGRGDDTVSTGEGDDQVRAGGGDDVVDTGAGDDTVRAGRGDDTVDAGAGNDTVIAGAGDDTVMAGAGDDTVRAGSGADTVDAGAGDDTVRAGSGADTVDGGSGDDTLYGGAGGDFITGSAGDDLIYGQGGEDQVLGGEGDDQVFGNAGNDLLDGNAGNDTVSGGAGDDRGEFVLAENANSLDSYSGGTGNDTLRIHVSGVELDDNREQLLGVANWIADGAMGTHEVTFANGSSLVLDGWGTLELYVDGTGPLDLSILENRRPEAADDNLSAAEGGTVISTAEELLANDVDPDGDGMTLTGLDTSLTRGSVTADDQGGFTYSTDGQFDALADGETATDTFSYSVADGRGGTATATVTVTITGVNDRPVAEAATFVADEDQGVSGTLGASDVDGDNLSFTLASGPARGQVTVNPDGSFSFDPLSEFDALGAGETSSEAFTYTVTDAQGATSSATVTLEVVGVNDAPVAVDSLAATNVDEAVSGVLTARDVDNDAAELSFSVLDDVAHGQLSVNGDGSYTYLPDSGFTGEDGFVFEVSDGEQTHSATVHIDVAGPTLAAASPELQSPGSFQVNETTESFQYQSDVDALPGGGFVTVWSSFNQDGSGFGVYGRLYDGEGKPVGGEFQVNTEVLDFQMLPSVATLSDGGFLVAWESRGQDGDGNAIVAQRFAADGARAGAEFVVNEAVTAGDQSLASASAVGEGYAVVWQSGVPGQTELYARSYGGDGQATGPEFQVGTTTPAGYQANAVVSGLGAAGLVIAWEVVAGANAPPQVHAQRFDLGGNPLGPELELGGSDLAARNPAVTELQDGGFVVAWVAERGDGDMDILGQRFDGNGDALGGPVQLNSQSEVNLSNPDVSALADGGFVVSWSSRSVDDSQGDILARRFDADGSPIDAEQFQIDTGSSQLQFLPSVAGLQDGGFVATWDSNEGTAPFDVYGKTYQPEAAATREVWAPKALTGTEGNDSLRGAAGPDVLDGRGGDDFLTGGGDGDLFVFGNGSGVDTITDFTPGADKIDLSAFHFDSADDFLLGAFEDDGDTVIELGDEESLTLIGVQLADLEVDDFIL